MKRFEVISRYRQGMSLSEIARQLGMSRTTVRKYCREYDDGVVSLENSQNEVELEEAIEKIVLEKKYDTSNRSKRKLTSPIMDRIKEIFESEKEKDARLGSHKQAMTAVEVHELLVEEKYDISYRTVANYWRKLKQKTKEAYIRQEYALGNRVEFDFGEVKLEISGVVKTFYLAVFASPASDFYWAYLFTHQRQSVFQEAHVLFFDMVGGVYHQVVYDNMKNVVTRFIGRNDKELNTHLLDLSLYYGFDINVTNCFSGNEKGTVEGRVKKVRKKCFSKTYQFKSLEEARQHLEKSLIKLNEACTIQEECQYLLPARPKFELAQIHQAKVNKYAMIQFETNHYSVPDYLVDQRVQLKVYDE